MVVPKKILAVVLAWHAAAPQSPSSSRSHTLSFLASCCHPGASLFAEAAPTSSSSTDAEKRRRQRERVERQERMERRARDREERLHSSSTTTSEKMRQQQRQREEEKRRWKEQGYEYVQSDVDEKPPFSVSIEHLFVTRKPRDAVDGVRSAISNALRGGFYGLAALFVGPIGGLKHSGAAGGAVGLVIGIVTGAIMPLAGLAAGGYQLLRGFLETPGAILDGFVRCKIYDETNRSWVEYRLENDLEEIAEALKLKEEQKKGGGGNGRRNSSAASSSKRKVKSTEYYDLLGVSPDGSSSDIRSAYRKRARKIHPDKNPDDPDAERKFRELSAAYQTLSDPAKRKQYDSSGIGVDPERPEGAGGPAMLDPFVFFAVLFGSERVEPYIGELGMAATFDALLKLGTASASQSSFESWEDIKTAFGFTEAALKRRKRETDIAVHLRGRVADYVDGYLTLGAFKDSCWEEAVGIAKGGSYGSSFLLAIGPALVAEADAFLGYRSSVLGSWRGPVSNARRNLLSLRRKFAVTKAVLRTAKESLMALYESAEIVPKNDNDDEARNRRRERLDDSDGTRKNKRDRVVFNDKELLKDNLSNTIPAVLDMAWAINYVDISNTLHGACGKLFHDADVSSWEERLRRAEAVHILGSQFYLVGLEVTGGNTTLSGDVDDIKAQANAAFMESLKRGRESNNDEM